MMFCRRFFQRLYGFLSLLLLLQECHPLIRNGFEKPEYRAAGNKSSDNNTNSYFYSPPSQLAIRGQGNQFDKSLQQHDTGGSDINPSIEVRVNPTPNPKSLVHIMVDHRHDDDMKSSPMTNFENVSRTATSNIHKRSVEHGNEKDKTHKRYVRAPKKEKTNGNQNSGKKASTSAFISDPPENIKNNFRLLLKEADKSYDLNGLQNAHFGLTKKNKKSNEIYFDKSSVHSLKLSDVSTDPLDQNYTKLTKPGIKVQTHTEQGLLAKMEDTVGKCYNCDEFYMWTKNSPCMKNEYKNLGTAKSCFATLVEFCYRKVKLNPWAIKRCNIGFKDFYGYKGKQSENSKLDFENEILKKTELIKNLAQSNTYKIPAEALDNMSDFIRFYQIAP